MIPVASPHAQYRRHREAIDAAVRRVLDSGWYILGGEVANFETEFARFAETVHGVGVGNGTDAITLALMATGIGPGDEVITVSHTAVATVAGIARAGAAPVFVDIDRDTYTLDPAGLDAALTPRTRAIIAVHLYGHPADMAPIRRFAEAHGLYVIEDCAQAHGARYHGQPVGAIGQIGCFSFYPTKNLGAAGDGGMVVTGDGEIARRLKMLREYGWERKFISEVPGMNTRLDEMQAAVLRAKLPHLETDNARRIEIARRYHRAFAGLPVKCPVAAADIHHVYHLYVIETAERSRLAEYLASRGVSTGIHYPQPVHLQPAYRRPGLALPETERISERILSLPMFPELSDEAVETVADAVIAFHAS